MLLEHGLKSKLKETKSKKQDITKKQDKTQYYG